MAELTREQFIKLVAQSIKQQVMAAIKSGDKELALKLLKSLENPKPPKPKKPSKLDQPYYFPFVYYS